MRKLISMMMMLCAIITFSACSSDDDNAGKNPVTNIVVPTSAAVGSEQTIQGKGFTSDMTLVLSQNDNNYEVVSKVSSNGITFTVPYTLVPGEASVSLKQGDNKWAIGTMTLTEAQNPIVSPRAPEYLSLGSAATIEGSGYEEGDGVVLVAAESSGDQGVKASGTVTAEGLSFTVPETAEGAYKVYVVRGNTKWYLSDAVVYKARRIKSVTYVNPMVAVMFGVEDGTMVLNFAYDEEGKLTSITSGLGADWDFAYEKKEDGSYEINTTSILYGQPITLTMKDGKVIKSTPMTAWDDTEKYNNWTYDGNRLKTVLNPGANFEGCQITDNSYNSDGNLETLDFGGEMKFAFGNTLAVPYTIDPCYFVNIMTYMLQGEDAFIGMLLNQTVVGSKYFPTTAKFYSVSETGEDVWTDVNLNTTFSNNELTISITETMADAGVYPTTIKVTYEDK